MVSFFNRYFGAFLKQYRLVCLLSIGWAVGIFFFPATAMATETRLQWQGDQGYQVQARLTYPDTLTEGMAAIEGRGKPQNLDALTVEIYNPNGQKLAVYNNLIAGQSGQDDFLQLHFDVAQQQLQGWLDIGGVKPGEYFLKGQPGISLDLFYLDVQGKETKVAHNDGQMSLGSSLPWMVRNFIVPQLINPLIGKKLVIFLEQELAASDEPRQWSFGG